MFRWVILIKFLEVCNGFLLIPLRSLESQSIHFMVEYEYEYIRPGSFPTVPDSDLTSVFDVSSTPAGMRGEAVRSALRSGRCIAWNLGNTPLKQGCLKIDGKGTIDFLNNKLSSKFQPLGNKFQEGCLLTSKGRVVDRIAVASLSSECAYLLTSPGHEGIHLFQRLDPLVFPLDRVKLHDLSASTTIISLASVKKEHVKKAIEEYVVPLLDSKTPLNLPEIHKCAQWDTTSGSKIIVMPTAILPETAVTGFTLVMIKHEDSDNLDQVIWNNLIGDQSPNGPVPIGALEFDTLRIEAGMPRFGRELLGASKNSSLLTPPGPLELHWDDLIDTSKGCYLGQEGVTSVLKNPRGPPRLLYQVIFDYEGNIFDSESNGDKGNIENLTKLPQIGSELVVLGSQNQIPVGVLTSVAEPSSTGDPNMLALALVRRADSILKAMKDRGIEIDRNLGKEPFADDPLWNGGNVMAGSAMLQPPPLDPLDGVEVVVKGTFTVGVLRCIPSRRYPIGQNMFSDIGEIYDEVQPGQGEIIVNRIQRRWNPDVEATLDALFEKQEQLRTRNSTPQKKNLQSLNLSQDADQLELERALEEANRAQEKADEFAAEAQRKAAKLEMLQKRANEAMLRRRQKQQESHFENKPSKPEENNDDIIKTEAKRKAEKLAMLQRRANEAMARRQKAKQKETE
jgi:folate-binding Fe-S cluster repair protein YgfZ